jgi:hypothetical protein
MSSVINRDRFTKYLDYQATFNGNPSFPVASFTENPVAAYLTQTRAAVQASVAGSVIAYQLPDKAARVVDTSAKPADAWIADFLSACADDFDGGEASAAELLGYLQD